jgi:hypothetical protein
MGRTGARVGQLVNEALHKLRASGLCDYLRGTTTPVAVSFSSIISITMALGQSTRERSLMHRSSVP